MKNSLLTMLAATALLSSAACEPMPSAPADSGDNGTDASMAADDGGSDAGLACTSHVPTSNFCSMESCSFAPLTLPDCDHQPNSFQFYNPDFCTNQLTLLVVAAGWCNPCMIEAPMIEQLITQNPDYQGRVRVLTIIFQNADYSTPTCTFAMQWKTRFGLTNQLLIDPSGATQRYYPSMAFPANMLVNGDGQIVYRQYGTSAGLMDLRNAIDNNLQ